MVRYEIDEPSELCLFRKSGDLTIPECTEALGEAYADPRWKPGFTEIWYCSDVDSLSVTLIELKELVRKSLDNPDGAAHVVVLRDQDWSIARLYVTLARRMGKDAEAYRTLTDVTDRLGLDALPEHLTVWLVSSASGSPAAPVSVL